MIALRHFHPKIPIGHAAILSIFSPSSGYTEIAAGSFPRLLVPEFIDAATLLAFSCSAAVLSIGAVASADSAAPQPSTDKMFFEAKVRPLLVDNCLNCHSEKKQKGGLRLDSLPAIS